MVVRKENRGRFVSPSDVIRVIKGTPPRPVDQVLSRIGKEKHKEVAESARCQSRKVLGKDFVLDHRPLPEGMVSSEVGRIVPIGNKGLRMRATIDLVIEEEDGDEVLVVEVKPGPLQDEYLVQTALNCMAEATKRRGKELNGMVYHYRDGSGVVIPRGGKKAWKDLRIVAEEAAEIVDIQERLDNNKAIRKSNRSKTGQLSLFSRQELSDDTVRRLNFEAVERRGRFDSHLEKSVRVLRGLVRIVEAEEKNP